MENKKYILSMFIISLFIISTLNNIFSCSLFNADTYNRENDKLDNISLNKLDYTISIPEININDNNIKGEIYSQIEIPECGFLAEVGKPKIPFLTLKYLLPYGNDIKDINVKGGESVKLEGSYKLEPAQESMLIGLDTIQEYKIDKKIYSSGEQFPNKFYEEIGTYKFRGYCILVINIYPISYIPKTGELSYYKTMDIQLSLSQNNKINSFFRGVEKDEKSVLDIIDNPNILQSYNIKDNKINNLKTSYLNPNSYDYLIITNEALLNSQGMYTFQDLANRKIENGYKTTIITVEEIYASYPGRDHQEMIRNCIIDAYQTWGIEYVLLGGDGDGSNVGEESNDPIIPARGLYAISELRFDYNIPSDLYYAALDGTWNDDNDPFWGEPGEDDLFAEVYIGRAPVDSEEELSNFVYKTLFHEDDTDSYLSKVLMVGEDLGWTSWGGDKMDELINGSDSHGFRTVGFPDTYNVDTLYDRDDPSHDWEISELTTIIKNGVHIINHLGHSNVDYNMKMRNDDIDNLTNTHFFFLYSQGCYNGAFDNRGTNVFHYYSYDCIAEHMTTTAKGAFAVIANSRYGYGDSIGTDGASQYYNRQFYDAIFGENIMEIGRANHDSKLDNIGYINKDSMRWIYYDLNLFGDPSATIHPQPNHNEPTLTTPNVSPLIKDQKTELNISILYTDIDNNNPLFINTIIDGNSYPMEKTNDLDIDFTDGCVYQFLTYMQPGTHSYSFECNDYKWKISTSEFTDLIINEAPNNNTPKLVNSSINPKIGYQNITEFQFFITYIDEDNNAPQSINVIINSTLYPLSKVDSYDLNYMDGCIYYYKTKLEDLGNYSYYFNCSDRFNSNATEIQLGPKVTFLKNYYMHTDNPYNWIDISDGTSLYLTGESYEKVDLPFDFRFYDKIFSTIYFGKYGYLSFSDNSPSDEINDAFPSAHIDNLYLIAPFWSYLVQNNKTHFQAGKLYIKSFDDYWIAQWTNIYHNDGDLIGTFQVILNKNGDITFNYDYIADISHGYTCGLNYGMNTEYYNSYNDFTNTTDDFSILFTSKTLDHDLEVKIQTSETPEINKNHPIIATIQNLGNYDEYAITFTLFLEGDNIGSIIIPELLIGEKKTIFFNWNPSDYGKYNFTVKILPILDETYLLNNVYTKILYLSNTKLFNGLYMNYDFEWYIGLFSEKESSIVSYSQITGRTFHVDWDIPIQTSGDYYRNTWNIDIANRSMSNYRGVWSLGSGCHTPMWIFPTVSIGDQIPIAIRDIGDHIFEVKNVSLYEVENYGVMEVYVLHDITTNNGYALYEKNTGILVSGKFYYKNDDGYAYYSLNLTMAHNNLEILKILNLTINSPIENSIFGSTTPNFSISISGSNINYTWYTLNGGKPIYYLGANGINTGSIDATTWMFLDEGSITIRFYVNDTAGNLISDEIFVIKDVSPPKIIINSPKYLDDFRRDSPSYEINITEANIEYTWYTLNNSGPIYFLGINGINKGIINSDIWNEFNNGPINITFYINDTTGIIIFDTVLIHKNVKVGSHGGIPGYDIYIVFGSISIILCILFVKFGKKNKF